MGILYDPTKPVKYDTTSRRWEAIKPLLFRVLIGSALMGFVLLILWLRRH
jgi:hypothetical protein